MTSFIDGHKALFRRRLRNKDLAEALGVTPSVAGKKLRGDVAWSLQDVFAAAELLDVDVATKPSCRVRKQRIPTNFRWPGFPMW